MAVEVSFPFDIDPVTGAPQKVFEDYGSRLMAFLACAESDTGVDHRQGGPTVVAATVSSVGQFRVSLFRALVEGFYYELVADGAGSTLDVPVTTNASSSPRMWRLFLQLDRTANRVKLVSRAGAATASPAPPTATATAMVREIPLVRATQAGTSALLGAVTIDPERPLTRRFAKGEAQLTVPASTTGVSAFIDFPLGTFSAAPDVWLSLDNTGAPLVLSTANVTSTSFRIGYRNLTGATVVSNCRWFAHQYS